jgi:pimeloyl-ACP methyl ester carboxylesterase
MRLLLAFLLLPFLADAQTFGNGDSIYMRQYGNGSQYAQMYIRQGYSRTFNNNVGFIFLTGRGERASSAADTSRIDDASFPKYIKQQAYRLPPNCIAITPQISTSSSQYLPSIVQAARNYLVNVYGVNPNRILFMGHSLGASGVNLYSWTYPEQMAAAFSVAGATTGVNGTYLDPIKMGSVPFLFVTDQADNTQNVSNPVKAIDTMMAVNASLLYLPETQFTYGGGHTAAADRVFNGSGFPKYMNWLLLHDKRLDSTVLHYVDSLTRGYDEAFYWKAYRLANKLPSSSFKTTQLGRLATERAAQVSQELVVDLKSTGGSAGTGFNAITNNTAGATISNLQWKDGTTSPIGFTVVTNGQSVKKAYTTDLTDYFGMPAGVLNDAFQFNQNPANYRLSNLDNTAKYDVYVYYFKRENSAIYNYTANFTLNGVTKSSGWQYYNTSQYVAFLNQSPASGALTLTGQGIVTNAEVCVSAIKLVKRPGTGNTAPIVSAGGDKSITLPISSVSVTATASDPGGSVASTLWQFVSGPVTANVVSPASLTTTLNGMTVEGEYVFSFRATDNLGASTTESIIVEVSPAAQVYPTASAGPDTSITLPVASIYIAGSGSDVDGTVASYQWSQIGSIPAALTFGSATSTTTQVSGFTAAGTYTIQLAVTDNDGLTTTDTRLVSALTGTPLKVTLNDVGVLMDQGGNQQPIRMTANIVDGTATGYSWSVIQGPLLTITGGTTQTATFSGFLPLADTVYVIRVTATDGVNTASDTATIKIRDAFKTFLLTCNPNTVKRKFRQGKTSGQEIYIPYAKRDNKYPGLQGGDTIMINGGDYSRIELSGFVAPRECPCVITFGDSIVHAGSPSLTTAAFNFGGGRDSSILGGVIIDGTRLWASRGIPYGFEVTGSGGFGFSGPLLFNAVIKGFYLDSVSTGIKIQSISDSLKPYYIADNFRNKNIEIAYNSITRTKTEGIYNGTTDPMGNGQGNDGPPVRGDSSYVHHNILGDNGWDALQHSNFGYVRYSNNLSYRSGTLGVSSQVFSLFTGSGTQEYADSNYIKDQYDGPGLLGHRVNTFTRNVVDGARVFYISQSAITGFFQDTMQNFINNNIFRGHIGSSAWIREANDQGAAEKFKAGVITGNLIEDTRSLSSVITTQYGSSTSGNTIQASVPLAGTWAEGLPAYQMYGIVQTVPGRHTFLELQGTPTNQPPVMNAGNDPTITLPLNTVTLSGTGSDIDGTVVSQLWTKTAGGSATITSPTSYTTTVTGLAAGAYVFRLTGTDNSGATGYDSAIVTVNPNTPPTADAGGITLITIPPTSISLEGGGGDDGSIVSYSWTRISGPNTPTITGANTSTPTLSGLVTGVYVYRLTVTDNGGLTDTDDATLIVTPLAVPGNKVRLRGRFIIKTP